MEGTVGPAQRAVRRLLSNTTQGKREAVGTDAQTGWQTTAALPSPPGADAGARIETRGGGVQTQLAPGQRGHRPRPGAVPTACRVISVLVPWSPQPSLPRADPFLCTRHCLPSPALSFRRPCRRFSLESGPPSRPALPVLLRTARLVSPHQGATIPAAGAASLPRP